MKLLAIETSAQACSVAIKLADKVKVIHQVAPREQAQRILSDIQTCLSECNIQLNQLDAIAFGCGPGSFTGIRIAASVAKGLAYAANLPVIAVSSLAALAQTAYHETGWKNLVVAVDARIEEVYWGRYQVNAGGLVEPLGEDTVCSPQEMTLTSDRDWYGVGEAWSIYEQIIPIRPSAVNTSVIATAAAVAELAAQKYSCHEVQSARDILPHYVRDQVANR